MSNATHGLRWANIARALKSRNYRLFLFGQGVSLIGTWMQRTALLWLVSTYFSEARSAAFWLGMVGFSSQIPAIVLTPLAGVLADRWDRHRMIMGTQILAMLQALVLAVLTLTGVLEIWHIIVLSLWQGAVNAVDVPTRQSFVVEMVDRPEDLNSAIALNSSIVNGGRMLGPALGGIMTALFGSGYCFLLNSVSFLAVIFALRAMRIKPRMIASARKRILGHLVEGFRYAMGFPPIRGLLLLRASVSLVGLPYASMLPVFASHLLGGGPRSYGMLVAGVGVGALSAAIYLASRSSVLGLGKVIVIATVVLGTGLIVFSCSRSFVLSLMLMPLLGMGQMLVMASTNSVLQTIVDDDKRGRVMSFHSLAFMGMVPIGNLLAGAFARHFGPPLAISIGGGLCIVTAIVFSKSLPGLRKLVLPVYVRKGISPE
jgi:MFS family permease